MDAIKKREVILPRIFSFAKRRNITVVMITHDVPGVCPLVDHVFVLEGGGLAQQGTHNELRQQSGGAYGRLLGLPP